MTERAEQIRLAALETDRRIGILTIDRPPVNALSQRMWDVLAEIGRELHSASAFRALVIRGEGRNFAAGADLQEISGLTVQAFAERNRVLQGALQLIATAPQITIAALSGHVLGGGFELALAADFRLADQTISIGLPEVSLGIMPGSGGTQRLPRLVGPSVAKDLILTGRRVHAAEALELRLVDHLIDGDVVHAAVERAGRFAAGPYALANAKRAVAAADDLGIDAGLALEADLIADCFASEDGRTGIRDFLDNGPGKAHFSGR